MKYLSVCSGIEAATVAWHPLGWQPVAFAEVEPFPAHILHHHYSSGRPRFMPSPDADGITDKERRARKAAIKAVSRLPERANGVPNFGDINQFQDWPDAEFDVLVGGTPCQSFSVAGLRKGLADPRGNLALVFLAIADRYRPRWLLWENVPGVLSSKEGRDFGAFTGGVGELGYGWAYRVLDAQYVRVDGFGRAVPQRRRRVFLVGYLGDWRRAAAVLFERESLSGNPAPCRAPGKDVARPLAACPPGGSGYRNDADTADNLVAKSLLANGSNGSVDFETNTLISVAGTLQNSGRAAGSATQQDVEAGLVIPISRVSAPERERALTTSNQRIDAETETLIVAHSLRADGFDASEDGTGRGTPLGPVACGVDITNTLLSVGVAGTLEAAQSKSNRGQGVIAFNARQDPIHDSSGPEGPLDTDGSTQAIAFSCKDHGGDAAASVAPTLRSMGHDGSHANAGGQVAVAIPFDTTQITSDKNYSRPQAGDTGHPLAAEAHAPAVAFNITPSNSNRDYSARKASYAQALTAGGNQPSARGGDQIAASDGEPDWAVRRLMPIECERLQGFPDGYSAIEYRGKPAADGPRYKALGNSMAVNAMRWLGVRIHLVEEIIEWTELAVQTRFGEAR